MVWVAATTSEDRRPLNGSAPAYEDVSFSLHDDDARFDRDVRRHAPRRVLELLLPLVPSEVESAVAPMLPARPSGRSVWIPNVNVAKLATHGRPALWLMSAWALEVLPRAQRVVPAPAHEKWDALIDIHAERPECAWLVADLFAALAAKQAPLGRRMILGVERRFGARGRRILAERAEGSALESLAAP